MGKFLIHVRAFSLMLADVEIGLSRRGSRVRVPSAPPVIFEKNP